MSDPNLAKSFESPLDSPIFRNHSSPTPFDSFDRSTSPTYPSKEPTLCEEERDDVGMQPLDVNTDDLIIEVHLVLFSFAMIPNYCARMEVACLLYKRTQDYLMKTARSLQL